MGARRLWHLIQRLTGDDLHPGVHVAPGYPDHDGLAGLHTLQGHAQLVKVLDVVLPDLEEDVFQLDTQGFRQARTTSSWLARSAAN